MQTISKDNRLLHTRGMGMDCVHALIYEIQARARENAYMLRYVQIFV